MKLFIFDLALLIPTLITIVIPTLISYYLINKNYKNAIKFSLYTGGLMATVLSIIIWTGRYSIISNLGEPFYSLIITGIGTLIAYLVAKKWVPITNMRRLLTYTAIGIFVIEYVLVVLLKIIPYSLVYSII